MAQDSVIEEVAPDVMQEISISHKKKPEVKTLTLAEMPIQVSDAEGSSWLPSVPSGTPSVVLSSPLPKEANVLVRDNRVELEGEDPKEPPESTSRVRFLLMGRCIEAEPLLSKEGTTGQSLQRECVNLPISEGPQQGDIMDVSAVGRQEYNEEDVVVAVLQECEEDDVAEASRQTDVVAASRQECDEEDDVAPNNQECREDDTVVAGRQECDKDFDEECRRECSVTRGVLSRSTRVSMPSPERSARRSVFVTRAVAVTTYGVIETLDDRTTRISTKLLPKNEQCARHKRPQLNGEPPPSVVWCSVCMVLCICVSEFN